MTERSQNQIAEGFQAAWKAHQQDLDALKKELGTLSDELAIGTAPTTEGAEPDRSQAESSESSESSPVRSLFAAAHRPEAERLGVLEEAMIRQAESLRRELAEVEALQHAVMAIENEFQTRDEQIRQLRGRVDAVSRTAQNVDHSLARLREFAVRSEDFAGAVRDVEDSLAELRDESAVLRHVQEALFSGDFPTLRFAVDSTLRILAWNPAMERLSGVSTAAARGRLLNECLPQDAHAAFVAPVELVKGAREGRVESVTCQGVDGQVRELRVFATPVSGAGGEADHDGVQGVLVEALDAARDAQLHDDALVNSRFGDALAVSFPGALIVLDADDRVVNWNTAAEQLFGIAAAEALGASFFALTTPLSKETYRQHFETHRKSDSAVRAKVNLETALGKRLCLITQAPFREPDGTTCGILVVVEELAVR